MPVLIPMLMSALGGIGVKLVETVIGPKILEWMMFKGAKGLAKHSKTEVDDEFVAKLEAAYYGKPDPTQPEG